MKNNTNMFFYLFFFLSFYISWGQDVIHNYGNIQIHDTGMVGFHSDVINDGTFDQNLGLVGFYGDNKSITLSGGSNLIFYDVEIESDDDFLLDNTMGIKNNLNLIVGDIITSRIASDININFIENSFYTGESDQTKVDGYAAISNKSEFIFPIGLNERIRPLRLVSTGTNDYAKSAYFYEDPNTPSTFGASFNTNTTENPLVVVSNFEFWDLDSSIASTVTLTWDSLSFVSLFTESIENLKVVGWNILTNQWEDLGNSAVNGTLENGEISSRPFIPNDYAIITLAGNSSILEPNSAIDFDNYFLTPNEDGQNDFLVIDGLENFPDNTLKIYNRYGTLVYIQKNYDNSFNGISNVSHVLKREKGLPSGIYFYIVELNDLKRKYQGYMYLSTFSEN